MAAALQCPTCGFKHRLDAIGDAQVFPCSKCSRPLKLPAGYRNGAPTTPRARQTTPRGPGTAAAGATPRRPAPSRVMDAGQVRLPLRILAWVVALVLGALVVAQLSKWTGFVGGNTLLDVMIDGTAGTYLRLFVLVPVWAFFATVLATVFIEAPGWWNRRQVAGAVPPSSASPQRSAGRVPTPKPAAARKPSAQAAGAGSITRRVVPDPTAQAAPAGPRPEAVAPRPDQRPRRIPRRDTGS